MYWSVVLTLIAKGSLNALILGSEDTAPQDCGSAFSAPRFAELKRPARVSYALVDYGFTAAA